MTITTQRVSADRRRGTAACFRACLGALDAEGPTAAAARQALLEKAGRALCFAPPRVIFAGVYGVVIFASLDTFGYVLVDGTRTGGMTTTGGSMDEAERSARRHLAQLQEDRASGWAVLDAWVVPEEDRAAHARWLSFQDRHAALRAGGYDGADIHERASGFGGWPEGIERPTEVAVPERRGA